MSIKSILPVIEQEKKRIESIISDTSKRIEKAPEGNVRLVKHKNHIQFYLRLDKAEKNGVYLPVSERPRGIALIQKKYDEKILAAAEKQNSALERFLKNYDPDALKNVFSACPDMRKKFISPVDISDKEYVRNWMEQEYEHKPFDENTPEHYTSKGERVRSKSEVMIADALRRAGIPYRYECELDLGGRVIHPDFTILRVRDRKEVYWEHLGRMDDPEYCEHALKRIRLYEASGLSLGIQLIITMESINLPINLSVINRTIKTYLL